ESFLEALSPEDRRYFEFQTWQEGVAQFTQYRMAELAAERYQPTPDYLALPDYVPFSEVARSLGANLREELPNLPLAAYGRVAFYYIGAAEALLIESRDRGWTRKRYFEGKFSLDDDLKSIGYTRGSSAAPSPRR